MRPSRRACGVVLCRAVPCRAVPPNLITLRKVVSEFSTLTVKCDIHGWYHDKDVFAFLSLVW